MKKLEKTIKQNIIRSLGSKLQNYAINYSLKTEKNKRVSKNQYRNLENNLGNENIQMKFPFFLTTAFFESSNLLISNEKRIIMPLNFRLMNKSFFFYTLQTLKSTKNIERSVIFFCKILYNRNNTHSVVE